MVSEYIKKLLNDKARLKKWKKITLALSCVVVFCVVYALTLPAITLEGKTICGMEEHTHTEECYQDDKLICDKEEHQHTEDCYEKEEQPVKNEVLNEPEETVQPDTQITSQEEEKVSEDEPKMVEDQTTTEQTDYELKNTDITSIEVNYKDANGHWQKVEVNNGEVKPGDTEIYLKVNFDKIKIEDLLNQHNCTLTYQIPDFLRDAKGAGDLYDGNKNIGTITVENSIAKVTLDKVYLQKLIETGNTHLKGYFWVQGQINLSTIVNNGEKAVLILGDKTVTLNYGPDCIERFGGVTIDKKVATIDTKNNYVAYTITVTAGKDGCKGLYVVDRFTSNGNLVNYAGNINSSETTLSGEPNNQEPYEIITGSTNHGKIYLADSADSTIKKPEAGQNNIANPCVVWDIQNMVTNESRTLTYYVKLKDTVNLRDLQITNRASLYSNGSQSVYDRGSGEANFTPTINYDGKFTKAVYDKIKRNDDGSYTIPFKLAVATDKDKSNYTIKNLQFRDYLRNIDNDLLQYVTFDNNSFELYKNDKLIESTKYNVKWSNETNNTNFKEWMKLQILRVLSFLEMMVIQLT